MAKKKENPLAFETRKFLCRKWPYMRIGGGWRFTAGIMVVDSQAQYDRLQRTDAFRAGQIIEIKEKKGPDGTPSVEDSAEMAALQELRKLQPRARKGAISSRSV